MVDTEDRMLIFAATELGSETRRGLREAAGKVYGSISEIAVNTLQENMRKFLRNLNTVLTIPSEDVGDMTLDTVEVSAQLDAKGNIGLWSVGTAELAAHGGIKLILKRK